LNKLIETYLVYRREVFLDGAAPALVRQRGAFERQLQDADRAYESFLRSNDIGDFTSAKTALATTYQTVFGERATTEAMLSQTRAQLSALEGQVAGAPAQINTQQDLDLSVQTQLLARRAEREQLLARYRPESQPVQDINAQIAQLERMIAGGATGTKDVRVGPNPVWQELETDRARLVATRDSLVARLATLDRQLGELRARQMRLTTLESENANLAAQRDVLQTNYRQFTQREAESRAAAALAREGADNIVVIERAAPPAQGSSLKKPILVLAFLFAAFTAVCAGLMRVFLRRRFVTASSAGRTLDLPVLAVAPMKPARA
ncbi:MAG TPA: chain-length determining protein, partial [Caulobacteraceae bacterium]